MAGDAEFKIKISTPADLAGAQQTSAAFQGIAADVQKVAAGAEQAGAATGRFAEAAGRLREANGQFVALGNNAQTTARHIGDAGHAAEGLAGFLKEGIGFDLGHRLVEGVAELPRMFAEFVHQGIEYNAEMQTMANGLGATFRSIEPEKYLNFDAARKAGTETLDLLRDRANALGVDFKGLAESYSANLNALIEGGVTKPAQQIELVSTLVQASTAKGVTGMQALRDSIDILNGRAGNIVLAKELGLTEDGLKRAAASGETYSYIMSKLGGYQEGAAAGAQSYAGTLNTIRNELDQLSGELAKPTFDRLLHLFQSGKINLGGAEAKADAAGVGEALGGLEDRAVSVLSIVGRLVDRLNTFNPLYQITKTDLSNDFQDGKTQAEVDAQSKQFASLRDKIAAAQTDKEVAEARKDLEAAIAAATERTAKAQGDAKNQAQQYLDILKTFRDPSYFGTDNSDAEAAAERKRKNAEAQAKYEALPRAHSAEAGLADDAAGAAQAAHDKRVETLAKQIEGNKQLAGITHQQAMEDAEREVKAQETLKANQSLNRELDATIAKTDKLLSSEDLGKKLQGVYGSIIGGLPEGARGGLGTAPTNDNLFAVSEAVEGIKPGDQAAIDAKKALADLIKEATRLQEDFNAAVAREGRDGEREKRDADEAAKNRQQTQDVIADEQAETAILAARGRGQKDVADALEKQRDILRETTRLQSAGVDYAEAQRLATERVNAANAASDDKAAEREQRREDAARQREAREQEHHRRGERETFTTQGYHDPNQDRGGGLHSGGLSTGGLGGSSGSSAADALARAPGHVSTWDPFDPSHHSRALSDRIAAAAERARLNSEPAPMTVTGIPSLDDQIPGNYVPGSRLVTGIGDIFSPPTAAASLGPMVGPNAAYNITAAGREAYDGSGYGGYNSEQRGIFGKDDSVGAGGSATADLRQVIRDLGEQVQKNHGKDKGIDQSFVNAIQALSNAIKESSGGKDPRIEALEREIRNLQGQIANKA